MAITQNWNIKARTHQCFVTGEKFTDEQAIVAAIFPDPEDVDRFVRRDYSEAAWDERGEDEAPFSSWHTHYEAPVKEEKPEVVEKESAEALLRRLVEEDESHTENARFILAVMLERKKQLKQIEVNNTPTSRLLIYEHEKSGEVFIVKDPELKLDEVDQVQEEVSELLGGGKKPSESFSESESDRGGRVRGRGRGRVRLRLRLKSSPSPRQSPRQRRPSELLDRDNGQHEAPRGVNLIGRTGFQARSGNRVAYGPDSPVCNQGVQTIKASRLQPDR